MYSTNALIHTVYMYATLRGAAGVRFEDLRTGQRGRVHEHERLDVLLRLLLRGAAGLGVGCGALRPRRGVTDGGGVFDDVHLHQ